MDTNDSLPTTPSTGPAPASEAPPAKSVQRRRRFNTDQKRRIVEDTLASGESFSVAARRHNVNANLLFKWRQQYEQGQLDPEAEAAPLVPVTITPDNTQVPVPQQGRFPRTGRLEIALARGHRLTITGSPCTETLRAVLESLAT
jgi:transposase